MILQGSKTPEKAADLELRLTQHKYKYKTVFVSRHCYPVASPTFPFETPDL